jgi:predicted CoA-binding protein
MSAPARRVVVIGASNDRRKFGNKAVRAFLRQGYDVVPVNTHETQIEGLRTYRSVLDVPGRVDLATVYLPPEVGLEIIDDIARKGITEVWLNPGAESPELLARALALGLQPIEACSIVGIGERP